MRGKRKLSNEFMFLLPLEILEAFACLPNIFRKIDLDRMIGDKISRNMKWKYIKRMEEMGLIVHASKKSYRKIYENLSEWIEKVLIPMVKRKEAKATFKFKDGYN